MRPPALPLLLLAVLLAVGCGKEENAGGGAASLSSGEVLAVTGTLRIRLRNAGSLAHNLKLRRNGRDVGGTSSLPAGESGEATVRVSPGRYEMLCTVGDHAELGMTGELQVKE